MTCNTETDETTKKKCRGYRGTGKTQAGYMSQVYPAYVMPVFSGEDDQKSSTVVTERACLVARPPGSVPVLPMASLPLSVRNGSLYKEFFLNNPLLGNKQQVKLVLTTSPTL